MQRDYCMRTHLYIRNSRADGNSKWLWEQNDKQFRSLRNAFELYLNFVRLSGKVKKIDACDSNSISSGDKVLNIVTLISCSEIITGTPQSVVPSNARLGAQARILKMRRSYSAIKRNSILCGAYFPENKKSRIPSFRQYTIFALVVARGTMSWLTRNKLHGLEIIL